MPPFLAVLRQNRRNSGSSAWPVNGYPKNYYDSRDFMCSAAQRLINAIKPSYYSLQRGRRAGDFGGRAENDYQN
jgi:hypothetical protein